MGEAEALQQGVYLLDQIQSQRSGLGEHVDVYAVSRVFQDQTADVEPPGGRNPSRQSLPTQTLQAIENTMRSVVLLRCCCVTEWRKHNSTQGPNT